MQGPVRIYDLICVCGTKKWFLGWSLKKWLKTIISNPQRSLGEGKQFETEGGVGNMLRWTCGRGIQRQGRQGSPGCCCWEGWVFAGSNGWRSQDKMSPRNRHLRCYLCPHKQMHLRQAQEKPALTPFLGSLWSQSSKPGPNGGWVRGSK